MRIFFTGRRKHDTLRNRDFCLYWSTRNKLKFAVVGWLTPDAYEKVALLFSAISRGVRSFLHRGSFGCATVKVLSSDRRHQTCWASPRLALFIHIRSNRVFNRREWIKRTDEIVVARYVVVSRGDRAREGRLGGTGRENPELWRLSCAEGSRTPRYVHRARAVSILKTLRYAQLSSLLSFADWHLPSREGLVFFAISCYVKFLRSRSFGASQSDRCWQTFDDTKRRRVSCYPTLLACSRVFNRREWA